MIKLAQISDRSVSGKPFKVYYDEADLRIWPKTRVETSFIQGVWLSDQELEALKQELEALKQELEALKQELEALKREYFDAANLYFEDSEMTRFDTFEEYENWKKLVAEKGEK